MTTKDYLATTLNKIRSQSPCTEGWAKLLKHLNKTAADDEPLSLLTVLDSNGLIDAIWCLRTEPTPERTQRFALSVARRVEHLHPAVKACNDVTERYVNGTATKAEIDAAEAAAARAAYAARAARAARAAANAAARAATCAAACAATNATNAATNATNAATNAADAADAAAYTAINAADAATNATNAADAAARAVARAVARAAEREAQAQIFKEIFA
jgi:hypothetical protein